MISSEYGIEGIFRDGKWNNKGFIEYEENNENCKSDLCGSTMLSILYNERGKKERVKLYA